MSEPALRPNPYVGLRPFFAEDSLYFYGRDEQTAELLDILRAHRFLGVVGSSGSGKSSLVRAGLLPALLGGFLVHDRDRWRRVQVKPGDAPMANLAAGLLEAMGGEATAEAAKALEADIRDGHTSAVVDFMAPRMESNANLFLLVDQFEEIFAFRGVDDDDSAPDLDLARRQVRARRRAEAADFVDLLLTLAAQRDQPIYVVLTMRTDFLGDCDLFYGLPEALNLGRYLVPRLSRDQLREAVECPARLKGASISSRLSDHVLNELGDRFDRLPVLQHALMRTWDAWQAAGATGPIDLPHFEPVDGQTGALDRSAGGLEGALDKDAERALLGLDLDVTRRVFQRLTDTDTSLRRVRSPARLSELSAVTGADPSVVEGIVRQFEGEGRSFLNRSDDGTPQDQRVDISHESLIRQWNRLRNWVDDERLSRDVFKKLVERSQSGALLQDPELQRMVDWWDGARPSAAWAARYSDQSADFAAGDTYLCSSVAARESLRELERQRADAERQQKARELEQAKALAKAKEGELQQALARGEEQKTARLRQRRLTRWANAALVVALGLLGLTVIQRWQADKLQTVADQERSSRVAQQLVAAASAEIDSARLQVGYLLAAAGIRSDSTAQSKLTVRRLLLAQPNLESVLGEPNGQEVWSVAFSPDGKTLATTGAGGSVILWDVEKRIRRGEPLQKHTEHVNSIAFSPDGKTLASGSADGTVMLWNVATGTPQGPPLTGHKGAVWSVAFSPDGKSLVSGSFGDGQSEGANSNTLILWDVTSRRQQVLEGHAAGVVAVAFSPDGKTIASVGATQEVPSAAQKGAIEGWLLLWNAPSATQARKPVPLRYAPSAVAFSPDSRTLAVAYSFGYVDMLEAAKPVPPENPMLTLEFGASSVAFRVDGRQLAVGSDDGTVAMWDLTPSGQWKATEPLKGGSAVLSVASNTSAPGVKVASGHSDGTVILWDLSEAARQRETPPTATPINLAFGAGDRLASLNLDGSVSLWDAQGQRTELQPAPVDAFAPAGVVAFDRTGKTLVVVRADGSVVRWDVETARRLGEPFDRGDRAKAFTNVAVSPDGLGLAYGMEDGSVELWDVENRQQPIGTLAGESPVVSLAFSSDGKMLASGGADGGVTLWDLETSTKRLTLAGQRALTTSVAFSPDDRTLASGHYDGRILVWNTTDSWHTSTPDTSPLVGHRDMVRAIIFKADGNTFASLSLDSRVALWDVATRQRLRALNDRRSDFTLLTVNSIAFSLDGMRLAAGTENGVRLWDATAGWTTDVDAWVRELCRRANRDLTPAEWETHVGRDRPYTPTCKGLPYPAVPQPPSK